MWLAAASEALRRSVAAAQMPFLKAWLEETLAACRHALSPTAFADAWRSGESAAAERAIADAFAELAM